MNRAIIALTLLLTAAAPAAHCSSLTEQRICALEAEAKFKNVGHTVEDGDAFMSHYDGARQICFAGVQFIKTYGDTTVVFRSVADAIGGQVYAIYSRDKKGSEEAKVTLCEVKTINGAHIRCKDDDEFDDLSRKNFGIIFK